ncbi:MAG: flagellar hook-length control protein FliK [Blautia sp.]|nr:flagellar hook-length control protein FliK [Blautia sp.]MCM1201169.1 flagellar hook-length control protein FliK [Bacteroides fragilis]
MASIPVNNNLNAFSRMVNKTAGAQGSQTAPYANASYAKQEEALKDSFNMVMNRLNAQAGPAADVQSISQPGAGTQAAAKMQTAVKAQPIVNTQTAADRQTSSSGTSAADSAKQDTAQDAKVSETGGNAADAAQKDNASDTVQNDEAAENAAEGNKAVEEPAKSGAADEQEAAITEAGQELVKDVAKEMGVTAEEVEEVMEILGLSAVQLLDPENMKQLLITISGNEDPLSIITDGELYGHLQSLLDTVSASLDELQTELGLPKEELKALAAGMAAAGESVETVKTAETPEVVKTPETSEMPEEPAAEDAEDMETPSLEGMKDYAVTVHRDGGEVKVKVQVDDAGANRSVREEVTRTPEVQTERETKSDNRGSFEENRGESSPQEPFIMQAPVEQQSLNEAAAGQQISERSASPEEIMNQITEYIRINLRSDVQEMELQLHPASLGTVNVQLAAKDGVITAQFTAQNETVKEAIEGQLVQLKEQFEEQGIKVEAVEVTVANYRFEQNFSGREENQEEGKRNGKKGPRRIDLNALDLEELPEDMEDSERIAAEMMAQNGNTVDYTA